MKSREKEGVVDDRLNVYGVQNLKIAGNFLSYYEKLDTYFEPFLPLFFRPQYRTRQYRR
jgi:hypothetical protein